MITPEGQYQTRAGAPVRILAVDLAGDRPVVAAIQTGDGEAVYTYPLDGRYCAEPRGLDLISVNR